MTFLPASGSPVTWTKTVPAFGRVTVNIADEDPSLASAAVSTTVSTSGVPILVERARYWPFTPDLWQEASERGLRRGDHFGAADCRRAFQCIGRQRHRPGGGHERDGDE